MWSTSAAPRSTGKPGAYGAQCPRPGRWGPLAVVGDNGLIHSQSCQEGIRRIITVRSALSCKDSPVERAVSQQWKVTRVKVAVIGPGHVGTVTAAPTRPFPGS
jgi:hypothetical protein